MRNRNLALIVNLLHRGVGIANLINVINPEFLVLGESLTAAYPYLEEAIEAEVSRRALRWQREHCKILLARYREDACLIGAVATIFWNILNDPDRARRPRFPSLARR